MLLGVSTTNQFRNQAWNKTSQNCFTDSPPWFQQKMIESDRICQYHSISSFSHYRKTGDLWVVSQRQVVEDTRHRSSIDPWRLRGGMFCQLSRAKGGVPVTAKWRIPAISCVICSSQVSHESFMIVMWWWQITKISKLWFCCKLWTQNAIHWSLTLPTRWTYLPSKRINTMKTAPTKRASKTYWFA